MIQLVEVYKIANEYRLREIYVNPEHVVAMRQDSRMIGRLEEGQLPHDLDEMQEFTKLYLDRGQLGIDVSVIGDLQSIKGKLGLDKKTLLKG